jgi:hypothetical protein
MARFMRKAFPADLCALGFNSSETGTLAPVDGGRGEVTALGVMESAIARCARRISWGRDGSKSRADVAWHRRGWDAKMARTAVRSTVNRLMLRIWSS